ncbi:Flp pilus assembly complex ATPase component TadA [bacterium]|nr:Flp pilus assembly complex ATPase component TadA [bacterium]
MIRRSFEDLLVEEGLISKEKLEEILKEYNKLDKVLPLPDYLVSAGYITEKQKAQLLAKLWGVPFVDLYETPPTEDVVRLLPRDLAYRLTVIPIRLEGNGRLVVAMKNPLDFFAIDQMRLITGMDIEPVMAVGEEIEHFLSELNPLTIPIKETVERALASAKTLGMDTGVSQEVEEISPERLQQMAEQAPVVGLANLIVTQAISERASDIHIEPMIDKLRIRYRIDGVLREAFNLPKEIQPSLLSRFKIISGMDIAEKRLPQDGRFSLAIEGKTYDFRVSTYPSVFGEKVVMRILDKSSILRGLDKLGMLPQTLERFEKIIRQPWGIILVTGPTGSGKSTTLYSVLNRLNTGEQNIVTLEDPVEYELPGIIQAQVNYKAGFTFAEGLRSILRQDPDIIMVGEIRDKETALLATEAALTGHLVLSTLHTNDAPSAVTRLMDMGIEPFLIASTVIGVLAQRLVRIICPFCKEPYEVQGEILRSLDIGQIETDKVQTFYKGKGCEKCRQTGYLGRTGIFEFMVVDDEIRDLILKRAPAHIIREAAAKGGMKNLKEDAFEKVLLGITTWEELIRVVFTG